jgi:Fe-S cluster assembly scaffold protein SufB
LDKVLLISNFEEYMQSANLQLQTTTPVFKHGLTISTKPMFNVFTQFSGTHFECKQEQDQNIPTNIFSIVEAPTEFGEHFDVSWNKNHVAHDSLSLQTLTMAQKHVCIIANENLVITHDVPLSLYIIVPKQHKKQITLTIKSQGGLPGGTSIRVQTIQHDCALTINHEIVGTVLCHKQQRIYGGNFECRDVVLTKTYVRNYVESTLLGVDAQSEINCAYLVKENGICDVFTANYHASHHSHSNIVTRGVLLDSAKALSRGLIHIGQQAFGSDAYEKQDALILSDYAEADAIPMLEILNHDVKCSHGSTVGQFDAEIIFYMMSRGLSRQDAEIELVRGYFGELFTLDI